MCARGNDERTGEVRRDEAGVKRGEARQGEAWRDAGRCGKKGGCLYYSRALLPYPRRSSQKLGAARDRQYQFWNAPTSTEIHKRDLGISRENVGPRGSIDLSKNIRRAAGARLNVFMYITRRGWTGGAAGETGVTHYARTTRNERAGNLTRGAVLFSNGT